MEFVSVILHTMCQVLGQQQESTEHWSYGYLYSTLQINVSHSPIHPAAERSTVQSNDPLLHVYIRYVGTLKGAGKDPAARAPGDPPCLTVHHCL